MQWKIEVSGETVRLYREGERGDVVVRADTEGYKVEIWPATGSGPAAACSATHKELDNWI